MSSITKLLETPQKNQKIARVTAKNLDGSYNVSVGSRTIKAKSALTGLKPSSQVVVVNTAEGPYIIGRNQFRVNKPTEVIIHG